MCNHCKVQSSPASLCISRFFTPSLSIRFLQNSLQQSILQNLSQLKSLPAGHSLVASSHTESPILMGPQKNMPQIFLQLSCYQTATPVPQGYLSSVPLSNVIPVTVGSLRAIPLTIFPWAPFGSHTHLTQGPAPAGVPSPALLEQHLEVYTAPDLVSFVRIGLISVGYYSIQLLLLLVITNKIHAQ